MFLHNIIYFDDSEADEIVQLYSMMCSVTLLALYPLYALQDSSISALVKFITQTYIDQKCDYVLLYTSSPPDVATTSSPQPCNVDVHLVVSKDDGSVTLTYNSSNPNATLFCGVDAMKARLCKNMHAPKSRLYWEASTSVTVYIIFIPTIYAGLNNSVITVGLSPGVHVFHGRATCVTSPREEDYFDLKNTTFTILPPDPCAGKQVTGVSGTHKLKHPFMFQILFQLSNELMNLIVFLGKFPLHS